MFSAHQLPFESVVIEGNSGSISSEAARFLTVHDIPVTSLHWGGLILSTLLPRDPVAGELRLAQFAVHSSTQSCAQIARAAWRKGCRSRTSCYAFCHGSIHVTVRQSRAL